MEKNMIGLNITPIENYSAPNESVGLKINTMPSIIKDDEEDTTCSMTINPISDNRNEVVRFVLTQATDIQDSMLPPEEPFIKEEYFKKEVTVKKLRNWFTNTIDRYGEEYFTLNKIKVEEVSRNADRIIAEMISGKIDYEASGKYIILPTVLSTLINFCSNKLAIEGAYQFALGYLYNDMTNTIGLDPGRMAALSVINDTLSRNITKAITICNQDIIIYDTVLRKLRIVEATKNATILIGLTTELNYLKKQTRNRY